MDMIDPQQPAGRAGAHQAVHAPGLLGGPRRGQVAPQLTAGPPGLQEGAAPREERVTAAGAAGSAGLGGPGGLAQRRHRGRPGQQQAQQHRDAP